MLLRSALLMLLCTFARANAQPRFTTQVMIVPTFSGTDRGLAVRARDIVRGRIGDGFPKSELRVVSGGEIADWLRRSGFDENADLSDGELREVAKKFRADERVTGVVRRSGNRVRINASLTLVRDVRMSQPVTGEGATVNEASDIVAREVISARRQLVLLRQCENALREGKNADAVTAGRAAVAAYGRAVPARMCLVNALSKSGATPDSIIAVAETTLAIAPTNPVALEHLATALDALGKTTEAAPIWVRLHATDSMNADMTERVVTALSRGGNAAVAQPLIDAGTDRHPDSLLLLKLRWLVHLANRDWKGAIAAGEGLVARDPATHADPDFYVRLAGAYRADSQPVRALAAAATGVSRFPKDAPVYLTYLQLLRAESDVALTRGLASFPESAELNVIAAQTHRSAGNPEAALAATKRALAANPRLPRGYLQLAQLEFEVGQLDSAYAAMELAQKHGEEPAAIAQLALARGNTLYKSAQTSQKREDFQRAMKFLALATKLGPTPESKFLLGASALSISQSAANDATAPKSCDLARLAEAALTEAEINLVSGGSAAPDAAKQFLDYVAQLRPYVADQVKSFC